MQLREEQKNMNIFKGENSDDELPSPIGKQDSSNSSDSDLSLDLDDFVSKNKLKRGKRATQHLKAQNKKLGRKIKGYGEGGTVDVENILLLV